MRLPGLPTDLLECLVDLTEDRIEDDTGLFSTSASAHKQWVTEITDHQGMNRETPSS